MERLADKDPEFHYVDGSYGEIESSGWENTFTQNILLEPASLPFWKSGFIINTKTDIKKIELVSQREIEDKFKGSKSRFLGQHFGYAIGGAAGAAMLSKAMQSMRRSGAKKLTLIETTIKLVMVDGNWLIGQVPPHILEKIAKNAELSIIRYNEKNGIDTPVKQLKPESSIQEPGSYPQQEANSSIADKLEKLTELRKHGHLSDQEFTAAKAKLLG